MHFNLYKILIEYLLAIYFLNIFLLPCSCLEFDRNHCGVSFRPYIRLQTSEHGEDAFDSFKSYTFENVKTMLAVISGKFSKILVEDGFAIEDKYVANSTYYNGSYPSVYTGEAAARVNEANGYKNLTVIYQLDQTMLENDFGTDISLALEAGQIANKISSGTVEGVSLWKSDNLSEMTRILKFLRSFRERFSQHDIKLGAWIDCRGLRRKDNTPEQNVQREIILESDFVVCRLLRNDYPQKGQSLNEADLVSSEFLEIRKIIREIKDVEVIVRTTLSSSEGSDAESSDNQTTFWQTMNLLAMQHDYTVYLDEAFDVPMKGSENGWWKLRENSEINLVGGYVEKVSESRLPDLSIKSTTMKPTVPRPSNVTSPSTTKDRVQQREKPSSTSVAAYRFGGNKIINVNMVLALLITGLIIREQ